MISVAISSHEASAPRRLTVGEYQATCEGIGRDYDWLIDGANSTPVCRRNNATLDLRMHEFDALLMLIRKPRARFDRRELYGPDVSHAAAKTRFQEIRKKVEPEKKGGAGAFRTVGRGEMDLRFTFVPDPALRYGLIQRHEEREEPIAQREGQLLACRWCGPYPKLNPNRWDDQDHRQHVEHLQQIWRSRHLTHAGPPART